MRLIPKQARSNKSFEAKVKRLTMQVRGQEEGLAPAVHPNTKLAPVRVFLRRLFFWSLLSAGLVFGTLLLGISGYHWIAGLEWIDSLLNASMILGGMGPVNELKTNAGKVFASVYALFCGLVLVGAMGLVLAPILHRMLHKFHLDEQDFDGQGGA